MKRTVTSLFVVLALLALCAVPAMAGNPETLTASVTVNSIVSLTVTDHGASGINFGSVTFGANIKELAQNGTNGAVSLTLGVEGNANCALRISGAGSFSAGAGKVLQLSQATWNTANDTNSAQNLTTSPVTMLVVAPGTTTQVYHWLTVPTETLAGTYTTTFTYAAVAQ